MVVTTYRISVPNRRKPVIVYLFRAADDDALAREFDHWPAGAVADPAPEEDSR